MNSAEQRFPVLLPLYHRYLESEESAAFIRAVSQRYVVSSLERLAVHQLTDVRRAAALALGFVANYESNAVLGRALNDSDRGVRLVAENGILQLWCRTGSEFQRQQLGILIRLNTSSQYREAAALADELLREDPGIAEAWNQRGIAHFHLGHYGEAIHDCHQALELNPYHFGAAAGMGQCYAELGDQTAALECFRRALKLNPELEAVRAQARRIQRLIDRH